MTWDLWNTIRRMSIDFDTEYKKLAEYETAKKKYDADLAAYNQAQSKYQSDLKDLQNTESTIR